MTVYKCSDIVEHVQADEILKLFRHCGIHGAVLTSWNTGRHLEIDCSDFGIQANKVYVQAKKV